MTMVMNDDFFDCFGAVFTSHDSIIMGKKYSLGHYAAQTLQMDMSLLDQISDAVQRFRYDLEVFFAARTASSAAVAHVSVLNLWALIGKLPVYEHFYPRDRKIEWLLQHMRSHSDEVDDMITSGTERNKMLNDWLTKLEQLPKQLARYIEDTSRMLEVSFEELESRKPYDYADAYIGYRQDMINPVLTEICEGEEIYDEPVMSPSQFIFPIQLSYVPVSTTAGTVLAEQMLFDDLLSFLNIDFCKGMVAGNLPRRCENCGKYFLAIGAYDTRYCNEIAPGETNRTCRMVGAHKKEKAKSNSQPILKEYNRVYNRIKARKRNGVITGGEWNHLVGYIQDLKSDALLGKYTDEELRQLFDKI